MGGGNKSQSLTSGIIGPGNLEWGSNSQTVLTHQPWPPVYSLPRHLTEPWI